MENYRMNYRNNSCRRNGCAGHAGMNYTEPTSSCGRKSSQEYKKASCKDGSEYDSKTTPCGCSSPAEYQTSSRDRIHWGDLPPAMAYIPSQNMCKTYSTSKGLRMGTIFPDLCKPFCGKGGGCH